MRSGRGHAIGCCRGRGIGSGRRCGMGSGRSKLKGTDKAMAYCPEGVP